MSRTPAPVATSHPNPVHPPAGAITAAEPPPTSVRRSSTVVRADLEATRERVERHVQGLRSEMHVRDVVVAGRPLPDHVRANPWVVVGGALGTAALLALLVATVRRRRAARRRPDGWEAVLDRLIAEGQHLDGEDGLEAGLRRALLRRSPVVVVERGAEPERDGFVRGAFAGAIKTALAFSLNTAVDRLLMQVIPPPPSDDTPSVSP